MRAISPISASSSTIAAARSIATATGMARWKQGLRLLGQLPNISIKISALTAYDPRPTASRGAVMEPRFSMRRSRGSGEPGIAKPF